MEGLESQRKRRVIENSMLLALSLAGHKDPSTAPIYLLRTFRVGDKEKGINLNDSQRWGRMGRLTDHKQPPKGIKQQFQNQQ